MNYPEPVMHDSRICFGIDFFDDEDDAKAADVIVRARREQYNGGWYDGMPCGRETRFDFERNGVRYFAVTRR